jgi:ATP-dependent DNA helicase PIF1
MLIKNLDETLVNGSMGRVVRFCDPAVYGTESDLETFTMAKEKPPSNTKAAPKASATKVGTRYPVIEFNVPNNGMREVMIVPEAFKVELPNGEIQASRTQVSGINQVFLDRC